MIDPEKTLEDLKLLNALCHGTVLDDAIELLKEQETVVRCKDCKDACICSDDWVICTHIDSNGNDKHPVDWFCADGERK